MKLTPYFDDGRTTIYVGDSMRIMPLLKAEIADALITDPPYCSGSFYLGGIAKDPKHKYCQNGNDQGRATFTGDHRSPRAFALWATLWMSEAFRVVKPSGYTMSFSDWRQIPTMTDVLQSGGFNWRGIATWNKGRGARAPHKGYLRHQCEYIVWGTKGRCRTRTDAGPFDGCFTFPVLQTDKFHLTGKPTPLMRELVRVVPIGGLIIDPFAGSGTTAVAAAIEGRRCIAIEMNEKYAAIAVKRLRTVAQAA